MPDATGYPRTSPGRYPPLDPNAPPAGGPDYVAPPMHHRSSNEAPTEAAADAPSLVQPAGVVDQPDFANTPVMPVSYVEPARSEPDE